MINFIRKLFAGGCGGDCNQGRTACNCMLPPPIPKSASKHHNFKPFSYNIKTGAISYRCRCGAWYSRGPEGWKLHESPINRSCK